MEQQYEIECVRCGETTLECLTEEEVRVTSDGIGPVYRPCGRCGKVTGWIKATSKHAEAEERGSAQQPVTNAQTVKSLVPRGEERLATSSERDEVNARLRRPDGL